MVEQVALHGVLARIRDLGVPLIEVRCEKSTKADEMPRRMEGQMRGLDREIQAEVAALGSQLNPPHLHVALHGSAALCDRRCFLREVCLVVCRPNGKLLTFTKTFYPPGVYRLLTGGVEPGESVLDVLRREIDHFVAWGIDGIECYRPRNTPEERAGLLALCDRLGLIPTGGSDWHGVWHGAIGDFCVGSEQMQKLLLRVG